jgi:type VI protein secretion system component Hcp
MRSAFRAVFPIFALLVVNAAFAQQTLVFSVDGWPRLSARDDGKLVANSFTWGVSQPAPTSPGPGAQSGKASIHDGVLVFPIGDAAVRFAKAALNGEHLRTVLVEFPSARAKPGGPAPFAARLSDVLVTFVNLSKSGADGGPGVAEVRLSASRIELFTNNQDPSTGAMRPGAKAGYDVKSGKSM